MPLLGTGPRVVRGQTATGESIALLAAFAVRHVLAAVASRVPPAAADGGHKRTDAINSLHLIPAEPMGELRKIPKAWERNALTRSKRTRTSRGSCLELGLGLTCRSVRKPCKEKLHLH